MKVLEQMLRPLTRFTAMELTVLSFVLASLVGGGMLMYTERNRPVQAFVPVHQQVKIVPVNADRAKQKILLEMHTGLKQVNYTGESFIDSWFTAVSALCVTGLNATDFSRFTLPGKIITLVLIQMGGLGIIAFTSIFAFTIFRNLSERLSFRKLLADILDTDHGMVKHFFKNILIYTFTIEGIATLIMGIRLQFFTDKALLDGLNPWWWAAFHAISGFNNAGFSLHPDNLIRFQTDPVIILTIAALIILGGLGYPVLIYLYSKVRYSADKKAVREAEVSHDLVGIASKVQVRVAIVGTILLLALGTIIAYFVEANNPVIRGFSPANQLLIHFFQSVSTRTAGFNSIDVGSLHVATLFIYIMLMFIGANPAGTAGGIKIPTVAVLYGYLKDWFKAPGQPVTLFGRRISKFAVSHAVRLFFFSVIFVALITFLISFVERDFLITPDPTFNFIKVLFEVVSAFGTVGMTMGYAGGVTSFSGILTPVSKFLLILTMIIGRVGPLTLLASLPWKRTNANEPLSEDFKNTDKIQIG